MRTRPLLVAMALALLAALVMAAFAMAPEGGSPDHPAPVESTGSPAGPPAAGGLPQALGNVLPEPLGPPEPTPRPPEAPVRFLAWGDSGHGNDEQRATGRAAARVCEDPGCGFVLMLGDNVYPDGILGPDDPQLGPKFEEPYAALDVPFYVSLGNHDVAKGKVDGAQRDNGDFQVAYDARSDRWTMPARHYSFREGPVQVIVLDLTVVHGQSTDPLAAAEQLAWLQDAWDEDATWRVAAAHFPYSSYGKHGNASDEVKRFLQQGVCGKADVYLAAHDHDLQWLPPAPGCPGTELVVSGATSDPRPLAREPGGAAHFARGDTLGFFWFEAAGGRLTGRAYDADGNVLFERALTKE